MQTSGRISLNKVLSLRMSESSSSSDSISSSASMMSTSPSPEAASFSSKKNALVPSIQELDRVAQSMLPKRSAVEFDEEEYIRHSISTAGTYFEEDDLERTYLYMSLAYRMSIQSNKFESMRTDCLATLVELRQALINLYSKPNACRWWLSFDRSRKTNKSPGSIPSPDLWTQIFPWFNNCVISLIRLSLLFICLKLKPCQMCPVYFMQTGLDARASCLQIKPAL